MIKRDRPENDETKIEVSEEMIEAGCKEMSLYDGDDPTEWQVAAVYRAMEKSRRNAI